MRRIVWRIIGLVTDCTGCVGVTALVVDRLNPIVPSGKRYRRFNHMSQLHYLAVLDQLETNSMLETMRRNGMRFRCRAMTNNANPWHQQILPM